MAVSEFIKKAALSVGFDACGIARAEELIEDAAFLRQWLSEKNHGEMHYLERNFEKRIDPQLLVPGCKSVVVVLMNYFPAQKQNQTAPRLAKYSWPETDYHFVLKQKLTQLEQEIISVFGTESVSDNAQHIFVDSAPVLERRWAERAGLGWIGKNTQLIHPGLGTFCFIGILMLNMEAEYDTPSLPHCGKCTLCIDRCPTQALEVQKLDARRCISYQTIEKKGEIDAEIRPKLSGFIIGCDICADVCPWNRKWAKSHQHAELNPLQEILEWEKTQWENFTKEEFDQKFHASAIKRAGFSKLKENIHYSH